MNSIRIDRGIATAFKKDDGSLVANVRLTKVGVFPYLHSDGRIIKEAKLPEELFKQSTIDSANGAVITDSHPNGLVTSDNFKTITKGNLSNVKRDGIYLVGQEKIYDSELIEKLSRGEQVEVSIGFKQRTDWTKGTFDGQDYDCIQRDIEINHLAHVDKGRAGDECRILLDSKDNDYAIMQEDVMNKPKTITWRVDGKDYNVDRSIIDKAVLSTIKKDEEVETGAEAAAAEAVAENPAIDRQAVLEEFQTMEKIIQAIKAKYGIEPDKLVDYIEKMNTLNEGLKATMQQTPQEINNAVSDALNVIRLSDKILGETKLDSINLKERKIAVIQKVYPSYKNGKFDSLTEQEINIGFETAIEIEKAKAVFQTTNVENKNDSVETKLDSLRESVEKAKQNYYNKGVR